MEDADESVGEGPECLVVDVAGCASLVVEPAAAGAVDQGRLAFGLVPEVIEWPGTEHSTTRLSRMEQEEVVDLHLEHPMVDLRARCHTPKPYPR